VTASGRVGRRKGIRAHQATLPPDEVTDVEGIPVTTVARTLFELAAVVDRHELERAMEQAEALRLADHTPLAALIVRYPGRRGTAVLREIIGKEARAAGITRSELEDRFLRFLADRELPAPRTNVWLQVGEDWIEADCVWSDARVAVELDSWTHHAGKAAFRRDRARDRRLEVAGWKPIRLTSWDLDEDAERLEAELFALTSARRATP
jgi:very-short-patch-repair endonuclease